MHTKLTAGSQTFSLGLSTLEGPLKLGTQLALGIEPGSSLIVVADRPSGPDLTLFSGTHDDPHRSAQASPEGTTRTCQREDSAWEPPDTAHPD